MVSHVSRLEEALEKWLAATTPLPAEFVPVHAAAGRVAAEDVCAPQPVPHFSRSAMDGYVCHDADVRRASSGRPVRLRITGTAVMGEAPGPGPGPGEAWSITTGAAMPARGDRVVPLEATRRDGDHLCIGSPPGPKTHVAGPGEDIQAGAALISAGEIIRPAMAGAMAACGIGTVRVIRRPRITLVATGDELIDAVDGPMALPAGHIFNSNAITLGGLLRALGCHVEYRGIVPDRPEAMRAAFVALRDGFDVALSTGGVSVGRYDAVHRTWLDLGARRIVGRIDLKPGGPFFAGRFPDGWVVGLSGTPVASLAAFHLLVRPFVARLMGRRRVVRPQLKASLVTGFPRPTNRLRALWARVQVNAARHPMVELLASASQGNFASLLEANALVLIPPPAPPLLPGSSVTTLMLDREEDGERLNITPAVPGPLAIGVVGESSSGKTTVISGLLRRLSREGVRAAAVKHAIHGFELDRAGSDSARMLAAGAAMVIVAGPAETALRVASPLETPDRLIALAAAAGEEAWGCPPALIFMEGFQHPTRAVIRVGAQKPHATAAEVLAALPAVTALAADSLDEELHKIADALACRLRGAEAPRPDLAKLPID
jgi:molybdopterin molybdotransferase